MKTVSRIVLFCLVAVLSLFAADDAKADGLMVLWWQVGDAGDEGEDRESLQNVTVTRFSGEPTSAFDLGVFDARIREKSTGGYLSLLNPEDFDCEDISTARFDFESMNVPTVWWADISDYASGSFVIELGNYEDGKWTVLAVSESVSYGDLASARAIADTDVGVDPNVMVPWNPKTYVVPEPSSGLMLVVGAALLALRRKREVSHG